MVVKSLELALAAKEDVVAVRQSTRSLAVEIGLSIIDQTKIVTAASELARNTVIHGGGGKANLEIVKDGAKQGLRLIFQDLGGSKRLCSEFAIESQVGVGTRVTITRWKA